MKILYFAWLKEKTGKSKEYFNNDSIKDIDCLLKFLSKKYPSLKKFIIKKDIIRIAVNLKYTTKNIKLNPNDEIAIFPPVSGG